MKPILKSKVSSHNKYTQLLITLIANFVLAPFMRGNIGELALSLIFLYAIIVIVKTSSRIPWYWSCCRELPFGSGTRSPKLNPLISNTMYNGQATYYSLLPHPPCIY